MIQIALAASGSSAAWAVEKYAFDYCMGQNISKLTVIHVMDTSLSHYGKFDQLASGNCKKDFVDYIYQSAEKNYLKLKDRICKMSQEKRIELHWKCIEGNPVSVISNFVSEQNISHLFVGKGKKRDSFFGPPKQTAQLLRRNCPCKVIAIPAE